MSGLSRTRDTLEVIYMVRLVVVLEGSGCEECRNVLAIGDMKFDYGGVWHDLYL